MLKKIFFDKLSLLAIFNHIAIFKGTDCTMKIVCVCAGGGVGVILLSSKLYLLPSSCLYNLERSLGYF